MVYEFVCTVGVVYEFVYPLCFCVLKGVHCTTNSICTTVFLCLDTVYAGVLFFFVGIGFMCLTKYKCVCVCRDMLALDISIIVFLLVPICVSGCCVWCVKVCAVVCMPFMSEYCSA